MGKWWEDHDDEQWSIKKYVKGPWGKKHSFTIVFFGGEGGVKEGCHETAKDDIGANKHVEGTGKHA